MSRKNRYKYYLIIIMFLTIFVVLNNKNLKRSLDNFLFPIQKKIYSFGTTVKETYENIGDYKILYEEKRQLKIKLAKYEILEEENKKLKERNKRLSKILEMKDISESEFKVGRVTFRSHSDINEQFYIDLGKDDGMEINMAVTIGNQIIGKIVEVNDNHSKVYMITREDFWIGGKTNKGLIGMVRGENNANGYLYFEPDIFEKNLKIGDKLYTSGISDIYPEGLYIGEVVDIYKEEKILYRSIAVDPGIDFKNISEVIIIKKRGSL